MLVIHLSPVIGLVGGFLTLVAFTLVSWWSLLGAVGLGLLFAAITTAIVVLTYPACRARYWKHVQIRKSKQARLEQELNSLLSASCCEEDSLAVEYNGWQGSVHTFYFSSRQFADAFIRANPGKCLNNGQIHH